jgi:hypothetical protein
LKRENGFAFGLVTAAAASPIATVAAIPAVSTAATLAGVAGTARKVVEWWVARRLGIIAVPYAVIAAGVAAEVTGALRRERREGFESHDCGGRVSSRLHEVASREGRIVTVG